MKTQVELDAESRLHDGGPVPDDTVEGLLEIIRKQRKQLRGAQGDLDELRFQLESASSRD